MLLPRASVRGHPAIPKAIVAWRGGTTTTNVRSLRSSPMSRLFVNTEKTGMEGIIEADNWVHTVGLHHFTSVAMAGLVPLALVLSPSSLNFPVDLALNAMIPLHAHLGMNSVISDYVPPFAQRATRYGMLVATGVMLFGLLRLNLEADGITETIKTVWRAPPTTEAESAKKKRVAKHKKAHRKRVRDKDE